MYYIFYIIASLALTLYFLNSKKIEKVSNFYKREVTEYLSKKFNISFNFLYPFIGFLFYITEALTVVLFIQAFYIGNFKVPTGSMEPLIKPGDKYLADMISYKFMAVKRGEIVVFKDPIKNIRFCKRVISLPGEKIAIGNDNKIYINGKSLNTKLNYYNHILHAKYSYPTLINNKTWLVPKKGDIIELKYAIFRYKTLDNLKSIWEIRKLLKTEDESSVLKNIIGIEESEVIINNKDITGIIMYKDILLKLIKGEKVTLDEDYYFLLGDNSLNSDDSRYWGFVKKSAIIGRPVIRWWPLDRIGILDTDY